jgi:hypothetical protein
MEGNVEIESGSERRALRAQRYGVWFWCMRGCNQRPQNHFLRFTLESYAVVATIQELRGMWIAYAYAPTCFAERAWCGEPRSGNEEADDPHSFQSFSQFQIPYATSFGNGNPS